MCIRDRPANAEEALLTKKGWTPGVYGNLSAWLDASDAKNFAKSDGSAPSTGETFAKWYDLSGNNHHAVIEAGTPYWNATLFGGNPGADLNGDRLRLENSETGMDGWSKLHVFTTFRYDSNTVWQYSFGKTSNVNGTSQAAWHFGLRRGDFNPPNVRAWVVNSSGTRYQHEGNQAETASIKQNLGLLSMFYDGTNFTTKIDGTQWKTATATGVLQSLPTTPVR